VVPYLQAFCAEEGYCILNEYKDFCFTQFSSVLAMTDVSLDDFVTYWSATVAENLHLSADSVYSIY